MVVVIAITYSQRTLLLPLFIGMSASIKGWIKTLTPKFLALVFKNSLFLKLKQLLIRSSTRFVVLSHKPWRHKMRWLKTSIASSVLSVVQLYLQSPLWLRTAIALAVLFATASSSYLVIALLIIPQPILIWVKNKIITTLNRTGITHLLTAVYRYLIPANTRHQWYMHSKWTLGRRQINAARSLRTRLITSKDHATIKPDAHRNRNSTEQR